MSVFAEREGLATSQTYSLLRLTPFPRLADRLPARASLRKSLRLTHLFYIHPSSNKFESIGYKKRGVEFLQHLFASFVLRKERDSNPRYSCPYTAFRVRPDRPLRHLSFQKRCKDRYFFVKLYRFGAKKCKKENILHLRAEYQ